MNELRIPTRVLQQRIADTELALSEAGLSALILYAQGSTLGPAARTHGYMRYLCDWDSHHNPSALVLRPGHPPVLFAVNVFAEFFAREYFWLSDVRFVKPGELGGHVARLCGETFGPSKQLAIVGRNEMPVPIWEMLDRALPDRNWVDFSADLDRHRIIKTDAQLALHRYAGGICDSLFALLKKEIASGKAAFQLQADMDRAARYAGSEYCMTWLTVGPVADYCRYFKEECQRIPQRGDQVLCGIYLMYEGHWGHAVRTGTMGPPTESQRRVFMIAEEMYDAMREALGPSRDLNEVQRVAESTLEDNCSEWGVDRVFRFRHGHALGLSYEDPIASAPFPHAYDPAPPTSRRLDAQSGMLFEFHPNLFVPGVAGACIGDMVVVTADGNEALTKFPRGMIDWSA